MEVSKNPAAFPIVLHSIMLPRGHGAWIHRAQDAVFKKRKIHDSMFKYRDERKPNPEEIEMSRVETRVFRTFPSFGLQSVLLKLCLSRE